jgi:poly(3-hydroxybutyrate) depolymerase
MREWGYHWDVIASSLIPSKPGRQRKHLKHGAAQLARLHRAGELTTLRLFQLLAVLSVSCVSATSAQQAVAARQGEVPGVGGAPYIEESGTFHFRLTDSDYALKYVLRHPVARSQWSGRLVIGVHGETGATVRYGRRQEVIGTLETQLDDMIGQYAVTAGHAYASFERGVGGREDALRILYGFRTAMAERLGLRLGRMPTLVYLVGWSTGGTLVRYAAEDSPVRVDGVIVVAGVGGNAAWVTHRPLVPQLEIVGTADTAILRYVREYRDVVRSKNRDARLRVYEIEGARHVSSEDDDIPSFERGTDPNRRARYVGSVPYFAIVHSSLDLLDAWVTQGTAPPADQVVTPPATIRR